MADEKNTECLRLHAAYGEMRREMSQPRYAALMEAFEADLKDDAFAYLPVAAENVEAMQKGGPAKWLALDTPKGRMFALFTSREEVSRHPAGNSVGVKLAAFVRSALGTRGCAGLLVNPLDGHHGIPVGEFGWDGAAGAYNLIDTENKISIHYVQHVLDPYAWCDGLHMELRETVYEGFGL